MLHRYQRRFLRPYYLCLAAAGSIPAGIDMEGRIVVAAVHSIRPASSPVAGEDRSIARLVREFPAADTHPEADRAAD